MKYSLLKRSNKTMNHAATSFPGKDFFLGCNYWASHAGIYMWRNWDASVIEADFQQLSAHGLCTLRVFPLWPDFQPISYLQADGGKYRDYEASEPVYEPGALSIRMMDHFLEMAALAKKYHIRLVVGLITGWMSGRLFVPPALQGRPVLTDPDSVLWQSRFVREFVRRTKHCESIAAWDLGNECNCMQADVTRVQAWCWACAISSAIRAADPSRPIVSGMHSLRPNRSWTMQDQGELTDVLTTHPYPFWVDHCMEEAIHEMRATVHASAESRFYADIGAKPCFAEEIGSMGPMIANGKHASAFLRTTLASLWAHRCNGAMWWCAYDQNQLNYPPYEWTACEGELGLFTADRVAKPMVETMVDFQNRLKAMPVSDLPEPSREAVCILTEDMDCWGNALGTWLLAKQSGFDLSFCYETQDIPDADLYIVPSVKGAHGLLKHTYRTLLDKVENGAQLYVSMDDGFVLEHQKVFGIELSHRRHRTAPAEIRFPDQQLLKVPCGTKLVFEPLQATVHCCESDGTPVLFSHSYGRGKTWLCTLPIESAVTENAGTPDMLYYRLYQSVAADVMRQRILHKQHPMLGITEHWHDADTVCCVLVNHATEAVSERLDLKPGWQTQDGKTVLDADLPANDWTYCFLCRKA